MLSTEITVDLVYLSALQHQLEEYKELKMGVGVNRVAVKKVMLPTSASTKMNRSVLDQRFWYIYHATVVALGQMEASGYSDETIKITQDYFEGLVIREYRINFMLDIARREQINIYINRKLAEYGATGKFELMNTFASYLEACGREVDDNILCAINTTNKLKRVCDTRVP